MLLPLPDRETKLKQLVAAITDQGGCASYLPVDLTLELDYEDITSKLTTLAGSPDILINAAGVNYRQHADDVTKTDWAKTLDLNLSIPFFFGAGARPRDDRKIIRAHRQHRFSTVISCF